MSTRVRKRIAEQMSEQATRLLEVSAVWPIHPLLELPRAACEEAAAILEDAAQELRHSSNKATA